MDDSNIITKNITDHITQLDGSTEQGRTIKLILSTISGYISQMHQEYRSLEVKIDEVSQNINDIKHIMTESIQENTRINTKIDRLDNDLANFSQKWENKLDALETKRIAPLEKFKIQAWTVIATLAALGTISQVMSYIANYKQ